MNRAKELSDRISRYGCNAQDLAATLRFLLERESQRIEAERERHEDATPVLSPLETRELWDAFRANDAGQP